MTEPGRDSRAVDRYNRLLRDLETSLESPVVPGELASWAANVRQAAEDVGESLESSVQSAHQRLYQEITAEDDDMTVRVEQLEAEDCGLITDYAGFAQNAAGLCHATDSGKLNELELEKAQEALVDKGIAFVIRARTQEAAIATWYGEAFFRDRGVVD
ncbi:MAG: hypothetical protein R3E01_32850 [Pirellulaceae bacterium]|nr:hypothetical protein [Planctomycetales bacterium]